MTEKTDQTEANRYPPLRPTPHARALVQARARMSKAWARANENMAEFFELDGRPEDAREARKAAKAEWREAAKDDREALKLIESELRAGGGAALAAAEQRGAKAAVAHLHSVIAEAVAELPVWPEGAYQTPMERDVSAVRAALVAALAR